MKTFIKELFVQLKQPTKSAKEIAAWAHVHYAQIHPHNDCTGKGARILFNMILAHFGERALVFPTDEEYTVALENELTEPGSLLQVCNREGDSLEREKPAAAERLPLIFWSAVA